MKSVLAETFAQVANAHPTAKFKIDGVPFNPSADYSQISLHLDRSGFPCGLHLERNGKRVSLDDAIREGFIIRPDDAPAILTLAQSHIEKKEAFHL